MSLISVYMDDGRVFEYNVANPMLAREHISAIIKSGYRHTPEDTNILEWYPPHRIIKCKCDNAGESTKYTDTTRAT